MGDVARLDSRTILFVSHNMAAIEALCSRCILLEGARRVRRLHRGGDRSVRRDQCSDSDGAVGDFDLARTRERGRWERHILQRVRFVDEVVCATGTVAMGDGLDIAIEVDGLDEISGIVGLQLFTDLGQLLATFHARMKPSRRAHPRASREEFLLHLGPLPLMPGRYWVRVGVWDPTQNREADAVERAGELRPDPGERLRKRVRRQVGGGLHVRGLRMGAPADRAAGTWEFGRAEQDGPSLSEERVRYAILGAGISGLATSYHLEHRDTTIFEATDHYAGHVHSEVRDGFTWDDGPHISFTANDYVRDLFAEMVDGEHEECPIRPSNYFRGSWIEHPAQTHLYQVPEPLRSECLDELPGQPRRRPGRPGTTRSGCTSRWGRCSPRPSRARTRASTGRPSRRTSTPIGSASGS